MSVNAMELHVYRLSEINAPNRWRVLVNVRGEIIYRESFNVETDLEALRKALDALEILRKDGL